MGWGSACKITIFIFPMGAIIYAVVVIKIVPNVDHNKQEKQIPRNTNKEQSDNKYSQQRPCPCAEGYIRKFKCKIWTVQRQKCHFWWLVLHFGRMHLWPERFECLFHWRLRESFITFHNTEQKQRIFYTVWAFCVRVLGYRSPHLTEIVDIFFEITGIITVTREPNKVCLDRKHADFYFCLAG